MSTLFDHQRSGAEWLANRDRAYLGDEPGLGKTRTIIAALQQRAYSPLIVTPAIVRSHWTRELATMRYEGTPVVKSYHEIVNGGNALMRELIQDYGIDALVLDEAHYVKHPTSRRTKQLLGRDGYLRRLPVAYFASGTPMPKNPAELWTSLVRIAPDLLLMLGLESRDDFVRRYLTTRKAWARGQQREKVVGVKDESLGELQHVIDSVMLRRTLDDVGLDVPELWWQTIALDPQGQLQGDAVLGNNPATNAKVRAFVESTMNDPAGYLADIANDPHVARMRRRIGEFKAPLVVEMLKAQLSEGDEKVVVFAHHRSVLDVLEQGLLPFGVARIDGDTPPRERDVQIGLFQEFDQARVFIGQNIAVQTGITLTAAQRAVLVEPDWNADVNYQLGKRIARIGQTRRTVAQMVTLAGTLDEAIVAQNRRETEMVGRALGER